eukprot:357580_1
MSHLLSHVVCSKSYEYSSAVYEPSYTSSRSHSSQKTAHLRSRCKSVATKCRSVARLINIMGYVGQLDIIHNKNDQDKMVEICQQNNFLLNDYIHLVTIHNNKFDEVLMLMNNNESVKCDVNNCAQCFNHYRARVTESKEKIKYIDEQKIELLFYTDIIDQMHFLLFHLHDFGLRVNREELQLHLNEISQQDNNTYVDCMFSSICKKIKEATKQLKKIDRLNCSRFNNNKFKLQNELYDNVQSATLRDDIFSFLHDRGLIETLLKHKLLDEEFDSDAIQNDINISCNGHNSNVKKWSNKTEYHLVTRYLHCYKKYSRSFAIGYRFYYWEYYKTKHEYDLDLTGGRNENDHLGYKPSDLFVDKKYNGLKEEILNNNVYHLNSYQFKLSLHKISKFMVTEKIMKMVYDYKDHDDDLRYDFPNVKPITVHHLLSICLYCDWDQLSTAFSSTFRKQKQFETISSVIQRNREYANWSRLIRETVELYGNTYHKERSDGSEYIGCCGPFFFWNVTCDDAITVQYKAKFTHLNLKVDRSSTNVWW